MPTLYHPALDRTHEVDSERVAALYRRSGWIDAGGHAEPEPESEPRDSDDADGDADPSTEGELQ